MEAGQQWPETKRLGRTQKPKKAPAHPIFRRLGKGWRSANSSRRYSSGTKLQTAVLMSVHSESWHLGRKNIPLLAEILGDRTRVNLVAVVEVPASKDV